MPIEGPEQQQHKADMLERMLEGRKVDLPLLEELAVRLKESNHLDASLGLTLLHHAAAFDFIEAIPLLVASGENVDVPDSRGVTPLMVSIEASSWRALKVLLENGANVNIGLGDRTPLFFAVDLKNAELTRDLLRAGAGLSLSFVDSFPAGGDRNRMADLLSIPYVANDATEILYPHPSKENEWITTLEQLRKLSLEDRLSILYKIPAGTKGLLPSVKQILGETAREVQLRRLAADLYVLFENDGNEKLSNIAHQLKNPGETEIAFKDMIGSLPADPVHHVLSCFAGMSLKEQDIAKARDSQKRAVLKAAVGQGEEEISDEEIEELVFGQDLESPKQEESVVDKSQGELQKEKKESKGKEREAKPQGYVPSYDRANKRKRDPENSDGASPLAQEHNERDSKRPKASF